jgi:DNA adenine methylase
MKPFFARLGGKSKLLKEILPLIPDHSIYVEPFVGGGAVFLSKRTATLEIINDLDKDIYDLWNDIIQISAEDLDKMDFRGTPERFLHYKTTKFDDVVKRLERNLYLTKVSFCQNRRTYNHLYNIKPFRADTLKLQLLDYQERLQNVLIENEDYRTIIEKYDTPETFFYLDPPYSDNQSSWNYASKISPRDLLETINTITGKFILSYDDTSENRELFSKYKIKIVPITYQFKTTKKSTELLISNF